MFISDEEADRKLNHPDNLRNLYPQSDQPIPPAVNTTNPDPGTEPNPQIPQAPVPEELKQVPQEPAFSLASAPEPEILPVEHKPLGGRKKGDLNIPPEMGGVIATVAQMDSVIEVAKAFGVSKTTVENYKNLKKDRRSKRDKQLEQAVANNADKKGIKELAMAKTLMALDTITLDDLKGAKIQHRASVAKDLANIASKFDEQKDARRRTRLVVYSPRGKQESDYGSIEVAAEIEN